MLGWMVPYLAAHLEQLYSLLQAPPQQPDPAEQQHCFIRCSAYDAAISWPSLPLPFAVKLSTLLTWVALASGDHTYKAHGG